MKRREFLMVGATGASGLLVLGGTAGGSIPKLPAGRPHPIPLPNMDAYVTRVDAGMEVISRWSPTQMASSFEGDRAAVDDLARKSLRTLYMTAMFSDLPEQGQRHPGMQNRVFDAIPEMDEATSGVADFLATRSQRQLDDLQFALRDRTNPAMMIFEALDQQALTLGVSTQRRLQTRMMMTQASWRLRNQPPSLVISETLDKVEKLAVTDVPAAARVDWNAARAGEQLFWQEQQETKRGATIITREPVVLKSSADSLKSARDRRIAGGARIMGLGILVGGVSAAATALGAWPLVFVATVGAVMILIGLIILLIGLLTPGERKGSR